MKSFSLILVTAFSVFLHPLSLHASYIWAWGNNQYGQLNIPSGLTNAVAIAAGDLHNLALDDSGRVIAWGDNEFGQTSVPSDLTNVFAIAAGGVSSFALKADGTVVGWGMQGVNDVPPNLHGVVSLSANEGHCLALRGDGSVAAWGQNFHGESTPPIDLTNVVAVSAGADHSLALRANGTVTAWGSNQYGQCNVPSSLTNVVAISGGGSFSLALRKDGRIIVWGDNADGEKNLPSDLTNIVAISAGGQTAMALKSGGTVEVWGFTGGFEPPPEITNVTAISLGYLGALAMAAKPQGKPVITFAGPVNQSVSAGSQAFFSVAANGLAPLSYQWYFGTNAIGGATNRWLSLSNVSQSGAYTVVVSNAAGSTTSQLLSLNVFPAVDINMVPAITLKGSVGSKYRLDYLEDLGPTNNWATLATVTLTNSPQVYFDMSSIGQPARLYRVVPLP